VSETEVADSEPPGETGGRTARVMETLISTADVSKAYGKPLHHGQALLLPAAEVLAIAGFGIGSGSGVGPDGRSRGRGGGGGGGGQALARSVAVIVSTPEGVMVKPVFDFAKIALAALTAAGFVWASWRGMARPKRFLSR
jgi:uncharacterized spore protein YtfJ